MLKVAYFRIDLLLGRELTRTESQVAAAIVAFTTTTSMAGRNLKFAAAVEHYFQIDLR